MDPPDASEHGADDLVGFFAALPASARAEYEALAARDRAFGEDVGAELAASSGLATPRGDGS